MDIMLSLATDAAGNALKGAFSGVGYLILIFIGASQHKAWSDKFNKGPMIIVFATMLLPLFLFIGGVATYLTTDDLKSFSDEGLTMTWEFVGLLYLGFFMAKVIQPGTDIWQITIGIFENRKS